MSKFSSNKLSRANLISITGAGQNSYNGQNAIGPVFKGGLSNTHVSSSGGEYDGGDRVIGFPNGYEVDGDLLFTVGWGDGFAVRRLNNDGSMTRIFYDSNFLYRDTSSTYNHLNGVAIDTTNKLGVVMTYNVDGYTTFDYSGCTNGGTTFVKDARPTHSNPQRFIGGAGSSGLNISSAGLYYASGIVAAGEWIYVGEYDTRHYRRVLRRNLNTGVEEVLGNSSGTGNLKSGTATIDRNGYRHWLFYDEVNDRVIYAAYYNSNFIVVEDASTSSPELVWCDMGDAGVGDDGYEQGFFCPDPVNSPNRFWIGANSRAVDVDITPCMSGNTATVHNQVYFNTETNIVFDALIRFGSKYQKTSGTPMDKIPSYSNFIRMHGDRGWAQMGGFIDTDNNKCHSFRRRDSLTEDTSTGGRGNSYRSDYGSGAVLMSSANGTKYWVQMGYGADGHSFKIWEENDNPFHLIGNWEAKWGTFTLDNSANIDQVFIINTENLYIPSTCTAIIYVSNNNGSTWETYDKDSTTSHVFSSTGTQLQVKLSCTGHPDKAPYYVGYKGDMTVALNSLHSAAKDSNIKFKINRKRLRH